MTTMRAAVARAFREPLSFEELAVPEPGRGQVLVRVAACGVCHSDVHAIDGDWDPLPNLPLVPGHEVAGTVTALGPGVEDVRVGETVGVPWMFSACGVCDHCLAGFETICGSGEATGYSVAGGYADYLVAPAAFVGRLPADADPGEIAPILCAGVTTYRGLKKTGARPGERVALVGIGGLGHLAVQYAIALGLSVTAVDVDPRKLELARSLGADVTVDGRDAEAVAAVSVHGVVVTAVAPAAFAQGVALTRPGGTCVWIGLPGGDRDAVTLSIAQVVDGERIVRGSNVGTRLDLREALAFVARGQVRATVERLPFDAANEALDRLRRGDVVGRLVLEL